MNSLVITANELCTRFSVVGVPLVTPSQHQIRKVGSDCLARDRLYVVEMYCICMTEILVLYVWKKC